MSGNKNKRWRAICCIIGLILFVFLLFAFVWVFCEYLVVQPGEYSKVTVDLG